MNKLTIAIPTYNRCNSVCNLLLEIIREDLLQIVNLIVIDDGSSDQTYLALQEIIENKLLSGDPNIKILDNKTNKGLASTFLRLFEECDTDYLLMVSDDDKIISNGIVSLIAYLEKISPDFISTAWLDINGNTMRSKNNEGKISLNDIRTATNHAPGLVYRVEAACSVVETMKSRISRNCYATSIFPQVVMVILQLLTRPCKARWCPIVVGGYRDGGPLPSQLFDSNGDSYHSVAGVWREQLAFIELFDDIVATSNIPKFKNIALHLKARECLSVFNRIEDAIANESKYVLFYFRLGSAIKNCQRPFQSIVNVFKYFLIKLQANIRLN